MNETFSLEDGKYEFERNNLGILVAARRHGERWPEGLELFQYTKVFHAALNEIERLRAPIDMVLHCPACHLQHIDESFKPGDAYEMHCPEKVLAKAWTNPPHRSHLCHGCGHIWRPADVPTNGVASVKTAGKNDSPISQPT